MDLVVASFNLHKIREFREMFKDLKQIDLYSLRDFPDCEEPEETEETFEGNATLKAEHAAKFTEKLVFADDSGLVIPSLGGAPGVYSKRYAGPGGSDSDCRKKLLKKLEGKKEIERSAYFECCIALADPSGLLKVITSRCEGMIIEEEKGAHGFGYDHLFVKNGYDRTFAEMDEELKNKVSHRAKAFEKLMMYLESI